MKKRKSKKNRKLHVQSRRKKVSIPQLEAKGASLWNRNLLPEAKRVYSKILSFEPDHLDAHFRLGYIYMRNGLYPQALDHFLKARELSPLDETIPYNLGETYGQMGNTEEATNCYLTCLELIRNKPGGPAQSNSQNTMISPTAVTASLAYLYFRTNKYDQAIEYTLKTFESEPDNLIANLVYAKLDRNKGHYEKAASRLAGLPLTRGNNLINASILNELGHVYDRLGEHDKAIQSITESNNLMAQSPDAMNIDPRQIPYSVHLAKKFVKNIDSINSQLFYQQKDEEFQAPVFLVGFPRSGTTLTEQILFDELEMTVSDEFPVIMNMINILPRILQRAFKYPEDLDSLSGEEISLLRKEYWTQMELKIPGAVGHQNNFLDKLPLNLINIPFIEHIFPDCKVIVALRDPRDVCISNFFQMFKLNESMVHFLDFGDTVKFYNTVMSLWIELRDKIKVPFFESRYENLVENKDEGVAALADFLNARTFKTENTKKGVPKRYISTPSYFDATQPIYRRSLERWRNYEDTLGKHFRELDEIARELGYPPCH